MSRGMILSFLFFGVIVLCTEVESGHQKEALFVRSKSAEHRSTIEPTFVLLKPGQIQRAEVAIRDFLQRLIGSLAGRMRLSSADGDGMPRTIGEICEAIRAKIMEFARACGLTRSVRQYEQIPRNSTLSGDWFSEGLLQGSLLLCDLVRVGEEAWFAIDHYFEMHNVTLRRSKELSSRKATRNFKFLSTINNAAKFSERLFKCLLPVTRKKGRASSFNLHRALAILAKGPPAGTMKVLKSRLDRAFSCHVSNNDTSGERLIALLCHSLIERAGHYNDCVKEMRRAEACLLSSTAQNSDDAIGSRALPVKPWLVAVKDLSSCRFYVDAHGDSKVRCNLGRGIPRTTAQRVKYIYERILNRRVSPRSFLHHIANKLANTLSSSEWGRQFAHDVYQYFAIFQEGRRKLKVFSRKAAGNKTLAPRRERISKSLELYKNGVLREAVVTAGNFHRSALEMQRFLVRGIGSLYKESWRDHVDILACVFDWLILLWLLLSGIQLDDTDISHLDDMLPAYSDSADMTSEYYYYDDEQTRHLAALRNDDQIRKAADEAFERLVRLMSHASEVRSRSATSTLACLANNLLLVAMFMETVSFISVLFCLGEHKDQHNSAFEESNDEWASHELKRRSLFPMDFAKADAMRKDSSMMLEVSEDVVSTSSERNANSITNVSMGASSDFYDLINIVPKNMKYG